MRRTLLFGFALLLVGCASPGAPTRDAPVTQLDPSKARLEISRSTDFMYLALSARVFVNGSQVAALSRGDTKVVDVDPGVVTVTTDSATSFGRYTIQTKVERKKTYAFEISPRGDSFLPAATLGYIGNAADTAVNEQSGVFKIVLKSAM